MKPISKILICIVAVCAFAAILFFANGLDDDDALADGASPTRDKYMPVIEYSGKKYTMNPDVTTVLFIGVDDFGEAESSEVYYNLGQADFLMLGVFNRETKSYSLLHINRDTIADVTVLGLGGKRVGTESMQIALSHCYGTGMQDSCDNTVEAVSNFLEGTPVDSYFAMNMDGVGILNDSVGGVEVLVSEDIPGYPQLKKGEEVTLEGDMALAYVRSRMTVADGTNINRMERQREYIQSFLKSLKKHMSDENFILKAYELVDEYVVTDMSADELSGTASLFDEYSYEGMKTISGETNYDGEYVEFYADEDALTQLLIDMMYIRYEK